jgi:hypothetical protein
MEKEHKILNVYLYHLPKDTVEERLMEIPIVRVVSNQIGFLVLIPQADRYDYAYFEKRVGYDFAKIFNYASSRGYWGINFSPEAPEIEGFPVYVDSFNTETIMEWLVRKKIDASLLDFLVEEAKKAEAINVNEQGINEQIDYLVGWYGNELELQYQIEKKLRESADLPLNAPPQEKK